MPFGIYLNPIAKYFLIGRDFLLTVCDLFDLLVSVLKAPAFSKAYATHLIGSTSRKK